MNKCGAWIRVTLYVLAAIACAYAIWGFIYSWDFIRFGISTGQIRFAGNEYVVVNLFMGNSIQYLFFAAILFTLGWFVHREERKEGLEKAKERVDPAETKDEGPEDRVPEAALEKDDEETGAEDA